MSVNLENFKFQTNSITGWESEEIKFGKEFTILLGGNGTGKTPMMWGMAYALGYPLDLATDITNNSSHTSFILNHAGSKYKFVRSTSKEFLVTVSKDKEDLQEFTSQLEFSNFMFKLFDIKPTELTPSKGEKAVVPYMSTFLPLIWVSQSRGWTFLYQPQTNQKFIRNQREEMIRLLLDIPPKNPFDRKKTYQEKKTELEIIKNRLDFSKENLNSYKKDLGSTANLKIDAVEQDKKNTRRMIDSARALLTQTQKNTADLDSAIGNQKIKIFRIKNEINDLKSKRDSLETAYAELDGDTEILESNEVATDEFRKVCGTEGCKVFENARIMYGKRLLYLRDQLKDIKNTSSSILEKIEEIELVLAQELKNLNDLEITRTNFLKSEGLDETIKIIDELGIKYSELDSKLRQLYSLEKLKNSFSELIIKKSALEEMVNDLRPKAGKTDRSRLLDILTIFRSNFTKWLEILETPNIKQSEIDDTFSVLINGQKFTEDSSEDGSTRARIVLAYFATLLETAVTKSNKHPGFMFLDTPRQHELHLPHLRKYFSELRKLIKQYNCQVIIACKDKIFEPQQNDAVYYPKFKFEKDLRYLGPKGLKTE